MRELAQIPELLRVPSMFPDFKSKKASLADLWENGDNRTVIKKFLFISFILWTVPLGVFYVLYVTDWIITSDENRALWAGGTAALLIQLVFVIYI